MKLHASVAGVGNPLLGYYESQERHQYQCGTIMASVFGAGGQPWTTCHRCPPEEAYDDARLRWSWAIPTPQAIATIVNNSPNGVVEIGAGTGYWARLLYEAGCDVAAFDANPPGSNGAAQAPTWHAEQEPFYPVEHGTPDAAELYPNRTLLLCWPCYDDPMAYDAVQAYAGDTIVYIGEGPSGCTADDRFHQTIGNEPCWHGDADSDGYSLGCDVCAMPVEWFEVASVSVPQWAGLHDRLHVYKRLREPS